MRTALLTAAALSLLSACSRVEPAAILTPQGVRTTTSFTASGPLDFVNPCNGELVVGTSTTTGEETVLTDGAGGIHTRTVFRTSGTYTGQTTGLTYTESGAGRSHVNRPSSGAVNEVVVLNGQFKASDGSTVVFRDRVVFVRDANGVVRVARFPSDTGSLTCK